MKKIQKIGMVIAMQKEVAPMLETFAKEERYEKIGQYEVWTYRLDDGKEIYIVQSGIGEIFASGATELLCVKYGVDLIINFGVCGALSDDLGELSVVLVGGVVHYDFDLSPIDNVEKARYSMFDSVVIPTDKELNDKVMSISTGIKKVICASADKFVADENIKKDLHDTYNADICEMESAGVLLTATGNGIPAVIIKAVSDGKRFNYANFQEMVVKASSQYIDIIKRLIEII